VDSNGAFTVKVHQEHGTDRVRIFPSGELDMGTAPILAAALQAAESAALNGSWLTSGTCCSWTAVASASCLGHMSGQATEDGASAWSTPHVGCAGSSS
jgi:hypothetical protein